MKKLSICIIALFVTATVLSSCSKKCRGGGWYGNRNLGYVPEQNKTDEACDLASIHTPEEDCEVTAP